MPKYKPLEDCKNKKCNFFTQKLLNDEEKKLNKVIISKCGSSKSKKHIINKQEAFKQLKCSEKIVKKSNFYKLRKNELKCISSKCKSESNRAMKLNMELLFKKQRKKKSIKLNKIK